MAEDVQQQEINEFLTSLQDQLGLTLQISSLSEHLTSIGVNCKGDLYDVRSKDIPTKIGMFNLTVLFWLLPLYYTLLYASLGHCRVSHFH